MNKMLALICLLMLCACAQSISNDATKGANVVEDNTSATWDKARDILQIPRNRPKPEERTQPRYCYQFLQDTVCYNRPVAGEEDRLVGWQDSKGNTGYVLPPGYRPETRELEPLKVVSVGSPPKVAEAKASPALKEVIFDPAELQPKELVPPKAE